MASTRPREIPLIEWLLNVLFLIIYLVPATYILIRERRKRKERPLFASKYLPLFSYSVICIVPVFFATFILQYLPGVCYFSFNIGIPLLWSLLYCLLEYYQLSRLYYCFSADKVHSNKGYPKWLFVLIGSMVFAMVIALFWSYLKAVGVVTRCGIRENGDFYFVRYNLFENQVPILRILLVPSIFFSIDLLILALYLWKSWSLTPRNSKHHGQNGVYVRIQLILNRIIVLSFLYIIIHLWWNVIVVVRAEILEVYDVSTAVEWILNIVRPMLWPVPFVSISYSVYLMQDHNTNEYVHFLSILTKYKLYFCCCCCHGMVRDQHRLVVGTEEPQSPKMKTVDTLDARKVSRGSK